MALWTPLDAATVFSWLDFSDAASLTLVSGKISAVADQVSGGPGASQSTDSLRPAYNATTECAEFRGNADSSTTGTRMNYPSAQTVKAFFAVFRDIISIGTTNGHSIIGADGSGVHEAAMNIASSPNNLSLDGSGTLYGKGALNGGATVGNFTSIENPEVGTFNKDGAGGNAVYGCWASDVLAFSKIGAGRSTGAYRGNYDLVHLVLLNAEPDQALIDRLMGWGLWSIGQQAQLPSGHPYESAAPTTGTTISPAAAVQLQVAGSPTLSVPGAISPDGAVQLQIAGSPTLSVPGIAISRPSDRGRVDLTASSVVDESGTTVVILGAQPSTDYENGSTSGATRQQVVYARVSGLSGLSPKFRAKYPTSPAVGTGWYANDRLMWRVAGSGVTGWQYFDNSAGGASADKEGWNNTAFAVDEIDVAFNLPWPVGEVDAWIDTLATTAYAVELPSSVGGGAHYYAQLDGSLYSDDRTGGTLSGVTLRQRCIKLADASTPPPSGRQKAAVVLATGVHSSEDAGSVSMMWFVDEWLSDPALRARMDLYIYALLVPSGRYVGRRRGTSQTTARAGTTNGARGTSTTGEDCNREFPDGTSAQWSIENTNTRSAWATDGIWSLLATTHGAFIDWHTDGIGSDPDIFVYTGTADADDDREAAWCAASQAYVTSATISQQYTSVDTTNTYARAQGATFAATVEFGYGTTDLIGFVEEVGRGFAQGLADAFDSGVVGGYVLSPAAAVQLQVAGSPTLSWAGALSPDAAVQLQVAGAATVSVGGALSPSGAVQLQVAGSPALSWAGTLSPAGAVHLQVAGVAVLGGVTSTLAPAGAVQLQVAGSPILTGPTSYTPSPRRTGRAIGTRTLRAA